MHHDNTQTVYSGGTVELSFAHCASASQFLGTWFPRNAQRNSKGGFRALARYAMEPLMYENIATKPHMFIYFNKNSYKRVEWVDDN